MPSIEQSLRSKLDMSNYTPGEPKSPANIIQPIISRGVFLRCPVPPQSPISVDNLSQYQREDVIPQFRVTI